MEKYALIRMSDEHRPPLVEIRNRQCNVKTLALSMSKQHKIIMLVDLLIIGLCPALLVWCATRMKDIDGIFIMSILSIVALIGGIMKTIRDFVNWLFTMNKMQEKMGWWYIEDMNNIFHDFIKAGCQVAAEEVAKVSGKNGETDVASNTLYTKAE